MPRKKQVAVQLSVRTWWTLVRRIGGLPDETLTPNYEKRSERVCFRHNDDVDRRNSKSSYQQPQLRWTS